MKASYLNYALLITNLCVLFFILTAQKKGETDGEITPLLRAKLIELVDDKGQCRAQFKVEESGEAVFRMKDSKGTIRIKMGAGTDGSGLVLLDNSTEVGVQILANSKNSFMKVTNKNGLTQTIKP